MHGHAHLHTCAAGGLNGVKDQSRLEMWGEDSPGTHFRATPADSFPHFNKFVPLFFNGEIRKRGHSREEGRGNLDLKGAGVMDKQGRH